MTVSERLQSKKQQAAIGRPVGHPLENPFHSQRVEADFLLRAEKVAERCFDPAPENKMKQYRLAHYNIGKSQFWALVYFYYVHASTSIVRQHCDIFPEEPRPLMKLNLKYFVNALTKRLGENLVGDRTSISKQYNAIKDMPIHVSQTTEQSVAFKRDLKKYRIIYFDVLKVWNMDL